MRFDFKVADVFVYKDGACSVSGHFEYGSVPSEGADARVEEDGTELRITSRALINRKPGGDRKLECLSIQASLPNPRVLRGKTLVGYWYK
jgi:hypothetical protein